MNANAITLNSTTIRAAEPLRREQIKLIEICGLILGQGTQNRLINTFELSLLKLIARQLARSISYTEVSPDIKAEDHIVLIALRDLCDSFKKTPGIPQDSLHLLDKLYGNNGQLSPTLSERENETLKLIAEGFSNKEIAVLMNIGVRTVETHRERIMRKLGIHNVAGLTRFAIAHHIIEIERPPSP